MFTIQYEAINGKTELQTFDSRSRQKLVTHLARFQHPIVAVYEQASPITKAIRNELQTLPYMSVHARAFVSSHR